MNFQFHHLSIQNTHLSTEALTFTNTAVNNTIIFASISCLISALVACINWFKFTRLPHNVNITKTEHFLKINMNKIAIGSRQFLLKEMIVEGIFVLIIFLIILGAVQRFASAYISLSFLIGSILTMIISLIILEITKNAAFKLAEQGYDSIGNIFVGVYEVTSTISFSVVSILILGLTLILLVVKQIKPTGTPLKDIFFPIVGYAFGIVIVSFFSRISGGIFAKAADLGTDMYGKINSQLSQDNVNNPGVITDLIGDNVGILLSNVLQILALAITTLALSLVVSSLQINSILSLNNHLLPLVNIAIGILISFSVNLIFISYFQPMSEYQVQKNLIAQFIISSILQLLILILSCYIMLPPSSLLKIGTNGLISAYFCQFSGIVGSLIIATLDFFLLSQNYKPIHQVVNACKTGAATNLIYGIALGMLSTVIPTVIIAISAYISFLLLGFYGITLTAVSVIYNLPLLISSSINQNIIDNILGLSIHSKNDYDATNRIQTVLLGAKCAGRFIKSQTFGVSVLISFSIYSFFVSNTNLGNKLIGLTQSIVFVGLILGAMIPYILSSIIIKMSGLLAMAFLDDLNNENFNNKAIKSGNYASVHQHDIGTAQYQQQIMSNIQWRSIIASIIPFLIVFLIPILLGLIFGTRVLIGYLPGFIISSFYLSVSLNNSGQVWSTVNKYILFGRFANDKGFELRNDKQIVKASILGDLVGDPFKDAAAPMANIFILIVAIVPLIFGPLISEIRGA